LPCIYFSLVLLPSFLFNEVPAGLLLYFRPSPNTRCIYPVLHAQGPASRMRSSLNATSSAPPLTDVSVDPVDPTHHRRAPSLLRRGTNAFLRLWSRVRGRGGREAMTRHTKYLILEAHNHPSETCGHLGHHSYTATAPSASDSPPTTGSHKASPYQREFYPAISRAFIFNLSCAIDTELTNFSF
jgi:hypothetical protein